MTWSKSWSFVARRARGGAVATGLVAGVAASIVWLGCGGDPEPSSADASAADSGVAPPLDAGADGSPIVDSGVDQASSLPECKIQRVVHLATNKAGLAWFTLVWPYPTVISAFQSGYAYDDPTRAVAVPTSADHPLFSRKTGGKAVWEGTGSNPMPTAFVLGNEAVYPLERIETPPENVMMAAVAKQEELKLPPAVLRLVTIGGATGAVPVGFAKGGVAAASVADAASIEFLYGLPDGGGVPAAEGRAIADVSKSATWYGAGARPSIVELARDLNVVANVFRRGLTSTFQLNVFLDDDPVDAFSDLPSLTKAADDLASVLHAFYVELAAIDEPSCSHAGKRLSLADNVVFIVSGDTPRNPFAASPWLNGYARFLYVRANGWLRPGWFGAMDPLGTRTLFDPATGSLATDNPAPAAVKNPTLTGILSSIVRGNTSILTAPWDSATTTYAGIIATPP